MESQPNTRARLAIVLAALIAFTILIIVVLAAGSGDEEERSFAAAPEPCVEAWNDSEIQTNLGKHLALAHSYSRAQVAYASDDGEQLEPDPFPGGRCIAIFAAASLDSEPGAAAQLQSKGRSWDPLSSSTSFSTLAELQSAALPAANADLTAEGSLQALPGGT